MEKIKNLYHSLPRPVQLWSFTVLIALAYTGLRLWMTGGKEYFLLIDRILAFYAFLGLITFLGFFMTKDPK